MTIREPGNYYELLRAIARGATHFNEILHQSKTSEPTADRTDTHDLDRLIELRGRIRGAGAAALYMFARDFHDSLTERAEHDGVRLVSADDLFAPPAS